MKRAAIVLLLAAAVPVAGQDMPLSQILPPGQGWQALAPTAFVNVGGLAADGKGRVYVSEVSSRRILRVDPDGKATVLAKLTEPPGGLAIDREGRALVTQPGEGHIVRIDDKGEASVLIGDLRGVVDLVVTRRGDIYCSIPADHAVVRIDPELKSRVVDQGIRSPTGLALWAGQGTLVVADAGERYLWAFRVNADGGLSAKERYYQLRGQADVPSGARALALDAAGRLYVTTLLGIQVFDPTGRLCGVLELPAGKVPVAMTFAGTDGNLLVVAAGDKLYARKTLAKGVR